jgi:hypothetical protein
MIILIMRNKKSRFQVLLKLNVSNTCRVTGYLLTYVRCGFRDFPRDGWVSSFKSFPRAFILTKHHAMKAYWWSDGTAPRIF